MPADDLPLAELAELAVATRESVSVEEQNPTVEQPLLSLLEAFLLENPGSPLGLLPPDEAAKWLATRENLIVWVASVPELDDIDVGWDDDLRYLWGECREHMVLRSFILNHQDRERRRWLNREQSVSLEAELQPVRVFMDRRLGHDFDVWRLISLYSDQVAAEIHNDGEDAANGDDPASRWVLFSALVDAGAPSFDAIVETMRNPK